MSASSVQLIDSGTLFVLDTWPLMEWYRRREPWNARLKSLLALASDATVRLHMSRLNAGEAYYNVAKDYGLAQVEAFTYTLGSLPIHIESVSDADIDGPANLKARYKISYADAFAAMLTIRLGAVLVTADLDFLTLAADDRLKVYWVGA